MTLDDMISLIQGGVPHTSATWADFGAGWGNFTQTLAHLLEPDSTIYAIDRDHRVFQHLRRDWSSPIQLHTISADFTLVIDDLSITRHSLDGILMANALHFVARNGSRNQQETLQRIQKYLRPDGRLLLVEYDEERPRSWLPYPVSYRLFAQLATDAGFTDVTLIGQRRSPSSGITMYAAVAHPPAL